jgi:hypothetical protein
MGEGQKEVGVNALAATRPGCEKEGERSERAPPPPLAKRISAASWRSNLRRFWLVFRDVQVEATP